MLTLVILGVAMLFLLGVSLGCSLGRHPETRVIDSIVNTALLTTCLSLLVLLAGTAEGLSVVPEQVAAAIESLTGG